MLLFIVKNMQRHKIFKDVNFYSQKNSSAVISIQNMGVANYCTIVTFRFRYSCSYLLQISAQICMLNVLPRPLQGSTVESVERKKLRSQAQAAFRRRSLRRRGIYSFLKCREVPSFSLHRPYHF